MTETHIRSVVKGVSWRIVGTLDTMLLVFLFSGNVSLAAIVGSTEAITKVILFWAHERAWQRIGWGRTVRATPVPERATG
ncbi:MAG: DUF2061 domain-containing protein [Candidatus Rokubacteria bacterium]|nr:DUF2061 domain-containing protein [Candidatus Rokubacteria bacterium]